MPTDTQIPGPQTQDAPSDYPVPSSVEFRLKAVQALFTDNGAAVDWLPAVVLTSDSGHVIARAVDQGVKVTAGSDAEVSWFPGVKHAAAATAGSGAEWFFASRQTSFNVLTNNPSRRIPWTHHVTSDPTVFSVTSGLGTDDTVHGLKAGIYIASGQMVWASPQTYPHSCVITTGFFGVSSGVFSPVSDSSSDTTAVGNTQNIHDAMIAVTQAVPGEISLTAHNWDSVTRAVTSAFYTIVYLPNSTLVT